MPPSVRRHLKQTVEVRRRGSHGAYGDYTYSAPETLPARKQVSQRAIRDQQGNEVLASTEVWLLEELQVGDLIDGEEIQSRANVVWLDGKTMRWDYFL